MQVACKTQELSWHVSASGGVTSWKPNAKALMEIYLAEQKRVMLNQHYEDIQNAMLSTCKMPTHFYFSGLTNSPEIKDKKETKLKLTKDDIGKEFENDNGEIFTLMHIGTINGVVSDFNGLFRLTPLIVGAGKLDNSVHFERMVKRHEPRWWLKDLPDADLLKYYWVSCDGSGNWFNYSAEPVIHKDDSYFHSGGPIQSMGCIKSMPTLKNEEWKLSKISIKELKEWQEVHGK